MPVHGEWRHLRANGDLAIRTGVHPEGRRPRRGRRRRRPGRRPGLDHRQGARPATSTSTAQTVGGATEAHLKDRRNLAEEGVITVVAIVDADTGRLAEPPDFLARGFVHDETTFNDVEPLIEKALATRRRGGRRRRASSSSS